MGPRKRPKPNPKADVPVQSQAESETPKPSPQVQNPFPNSEVETAVPGPSGDAVSPIKANDGGNVAQTGRTWYGGTWQRGTKDVPITQVAKESITAASGAASDAVAVARAHTPQLPTTPLKSPTVYLSRSIGSSSRSLPSAATTTKINITSNTPVPVIGFAQEGQPRRSSDLLKQRSVETVNRPSSVGEKAQAPSSDSDAPLNGDAVVESKDKPQEAFKSNERSARWLNWFSNHGSPENDDKATANSVASSGQTAVAIEDPPQNTPSEVLPDDIPAQRRNSDPSPVSPRPQQNQSSRSWLGLWGNVTTQSQDGTSVSDTGMATIRSDTGENALPLQSVQSDVTSISPNPSSRPSETGKSYGWAFWSKDQPQNATDGEKDIGSDIGELVQAGPDDQSKPEKSLANRSGGTPHKGGKRQRPQSLQIYEDASKPPIFQEDVKDIDKASTLSVNSKSKSALNTNVKAKQMPANLLLPAFNSSYEIEERPSLLSQLSRLLQLAPSLEPKHVGIIQNPHRIKTALSIGIHGYFPAPLIRSVLGQPTGTSIRFANSAASAIHKWTQKQGYSCEIEKVALEGEGKISERIDLLWKLMLNWIEKIRKADFVMIACHSQGVPVAMMLVAKLIVFGCVNTARIGVCAMAGVNLGPFPEYKSRWINGSAGELFDFASPDSQVSKDYETALDVALRFGVKIVYIGSIDDQLVSLESSTFGAISHPYIYRAVFVDGRVHAPDFLTHLVGFALKLRNLGISDHGLIRELSTPLAGSLYGGEGHSRIYDDEAVYYLAVEHALETTLLGAIPLQSHRQNPVITTQNPYILPFAMRGLLEEDYVRTELLGELTELVRQFDEWKPASKVLKDVKFRLEGVRSKL